MEQTSLNQFSGLKLKDDEIQLRLNKNGIPVWISISEVKDDSLLIDIYELFYKILEKILINMDDSSSNLGIRSRSKERKSDFVAHLSRDIESVANTEIDITKGRDEQGMITYNAISNDKPIYVPQNDVDEEKGFVTFGLEDFEDEPEEIIFDRKGRIKHKKEVKENNLKDMSLIENISDLDIKDENDNNKSKNVNLNVNIKSSSASPDIRNQNIMKRYSYYTRDAIRRFRKYVSKFSSNDVRRLIEKSMFFRKKNKTRKELKITNEDILRGLSNYAKNVNLNLNQRKVVSVNPFLNKNIGLNVKKHSFKQKRTSDYSLKKYKELTPKKSYTDSRIEYYTLLNDKSIANDTTERYNTSLTNLFDSSINLTPGASNINNLNLNLSLKKQEMGSKNIIKEIHPRQIINQNIDKSFRTPVKGIKRGNSETENEPREFKFLKKSPNIYKNSPVKKTTPKRVSDKELLDDNDDFIVIDNKQWSELPFTMSDSSDTFIF